MIEYRKATKEDLAELLKVRMDFLEDSHDFGVEEQDTWLLEANKEFLSRVCFGENFVQWLAVEDGKVAATGSVSFFDLPPLPTRPSGKVAYIGNIYTYPAYRKKGLGAKMFSLVLETAREMGAKQMLLNASEMGRPLYEKYGFAESESIMEFFEPRPRMQER